MRLAGVTTLILALALGGCGTEDPPTPPAPTEDSPTRPAPTEDPPTRPAPTEEEAVDPAATWAAFRGPTGDGVVPPTAKPLVKLDPARHTIWKTPLPIGGFSSPIVYGDRIFLTVKGGRILAFDRQGGKLLWDTALRVPPLPPLAEEAEEFKPGFSGLAAPTPCADGRGVYAFFGDGVIGGVDFTGRQIWAKRLVVRPLNMYGLAASPVLHKGLLIQQVDLDIEEDDDFNETFLSFIVALDTATGKEVWRKARKVGSSWPTPLLVKEANRRSLITCGQPWVIAYDPATGAERWRAKRLEGDIAASPVASGGLLYASSGPSGDLLAIRLGGSGNVTDSHIAWRFNESLPDAASAVCDGKRYIQVDDAGDVRALDARQGTPLWTKTLHGTFYASPVLAGGRVYFVNRDGLMYVMDPGTGEVIHKITLGAKMKVDASPAFVGPYIYLRTDKHLICFGPKAQEQPSGGAPR